MILAFLSFRGAKDSRPIATGGVHAFQENQ